MHIWNRLGFAGVLLAGLLTVGCVTTQRRVHTRQEWYGPGGTSGGSSVYEERIESGPHVDIRYRDEGTDVRVRQ